MNRSIFKRIAKKHGVKISEVKRDMQHALDEAFKAPKGCSSIGALDDAKPTLEEFIEYAKQKVKESS